MLPVTPTTLKPLNVEAALEKPFLPLHNFPPPSTFARACLFTGVRIRHGSEPASLRPQPTPYDSISPPIDTADFNVGVNQDNDNQHGQGQNGNQNDSSNRKGKEKEKKQHGDRKGKGQERNNDRSNFPPESKSTSAQLHIFAGCTFFIQNSPGYQEDEGHETLIRLIETNGGKISDSPLSSSVTHIIVKVPIGIDILIHFPPSPSASATDIVLSMDQITSLAETATPSALAQSGWGIYELLSKLGLRRYEGSPVILRSEWIKACIVQRRVIGDEDDWGGHRVFASVESTTSPLPDGMTHSQSPSTPLIDVNRYSARSSLSLLSVSPSQPPESPTRLPAISAGGTAATSTSAASTAISASTQARPPGTSLPNATPTASSMEQVQRPVLRQYQQSRRRLSLPHPAYFARVPRIAPPPPTVVNLHRPIYSPLPSAAGPSRPRPPPTTTPVQGRPQRRHPMSLPSISIVSNPTNLYQYRTGTQSARLSDSPGASARRDRLHPYVLPQIQPQSPLSAGPSGRLMLPQIQGGRATRTRIRDSLPSLASVLAGMSGHSIGTALDGQYERTMRIGEQLHHPTTSISLGQHVPSVAEPILNPRSNPAAISIEERGTLASPRLRRMAGRNFRTSQPPSEKEGVRQNRTSPTGSNTNAGESSRRGLLTRTMLPPREQYEYSRLNQFQTASTTTASSDRALLSVPIHPRMNIPVPSASFSLFSRIKFFCHPFDPEIARAVIDWGRGELTQMHQANVVIFVRPIDTSSSSSDVRRSHYQPKDDIERTILRAALQAGRPHIVSSEWVYDSLAARTTLPVEAYNIRFPIQPAPPPPPPPRGSMEETEVITIPSQSTPGVDITPDRPSSSTATATNPATGTGPYPSPLRWRHYGIPSMRLPPSLFQVNNPNISSIKALLAQRDSIAASSATSPSASASARAKRLRQESVISLNSPEQQKLRTKKREEKRAKRAGPKSTTKSTRVQKQKVGAADAKEKETLPQTQSGSASASASGSGSRLRGFWKEIARDEDKNNKDSKEEEEKDASNNPLATVRTPMSLSIMMNSDSEPNQNDRSAVLVLDSPDTDQSRKDGK